MLCLYNKHSVLALCLMLFLNCFLLFSVPCKHFRDPDNASVIIAQGMSHAPAKILF